MFVVLVLLIYTVFKFYFQTEHIDFKLWFIGNRQKKRKSMLKDALIVYGKLVERHFLLYNNSAREINFLIKKRNTVDI